MKNNTIEPKNNFPEDIKDISVKHNLSKFEYDLFHEEDYIPGRIIRVKKTGTPNRGEKWKIYQDDKLVMTIDGDMLNKKEKAFLYSYEGISFIINQYKNNVSSVNKFKKNIKTELNKKPASS